MNALLLTAIFGVIMMFSSFLLQSKAAIRGLAITGLIIVVTGNILEMSGLVFFKIDTKGMIGFDRFALLFNTIVFISTLVYFLLSARDMEKVGINYSEYFSLIFFVLCGVVIASSFNSLLMLFLGIEIISIPLYILTGSDKRNLKSNEASLKYFLMGAFSTGLMLLGIAFIYGATDKGSFFLEDIAASHSMGSAMMTTGLILLFCSLAFKVSAAPFHFWTPDVYDGAPTVFTSFMATIVKAAAFVAFIRLFQGGFSNFLPEWKMVAAIMTALTLLIGNITAVFQQSVKRMLAYSSIAQAGFMMFALVALNGKGKEGLLFYTAAYSIATIGVFAILLRMKDYTFEGFNGLAKTQPVLAATNAIFLLSLAGIPATAGFMAKFYMLNAAVSTGSLLWLVILGIVCAAISEYYYFRVIQAMYFKDGDVQQIEASTTFKGLLVTVAVIVVLFGIFPEWLTSFLYYFA